MSLRPGLGYSNAALAAAVTILNAAGTGEIPVAGNHQRIRIAASGEAVWVKLSKGAVVAATDGTNDEILVPVGAPVVIDMEKDDNLSIINAGAGCRVSAHQAN